jgi:hypothetical protein
MILFGQILLITTYIILMIRTDLLRKVDINRRNRKKMPPHRELYQGRILRYLFLFEKIDETDTPNDIRKIQVVNLIDKIAIACFISFSIIFIYSFITY